MPQFLMNILAESENSIIGKIIPFIFVLIWVISGIVGSLSKKKRQEEVRQRAEEAIGNSPVDFNVDLDLPPRPVPSVRGQKPSPPPVPQHAMERHRTAERDPVRTMPTKTAPRLATGSREQETVARRKRMTQQVERDRVAAARKLAAFEASQPVAVANAVAEARPNQFMPARATRSVGAEAPAISRWLTPKTLRSQFILTEVFQPPVALRPERFN